MERAKEELRQSIHEIKDNLRYLESEVQAEEDDLHYFECLLETTELDLWEMP